MHFSEPQIRIQRGYSSVLVIFLFQEGFDHVLLRSGLCGDHTGSGSEESKRSDACTPRSLER